MEQQVEGEVIEKLRIANVVVIVARLSVVGVAVAAADVVGVEGLWKVVADLIEVQEEQDLFDETCLLIVKTLPLPGQPFTAAFVV